MLKFRGRLSFPKLDAKKYNRTLEEACETQLRQAARAWLRAVYPAVPVWTGMARGSLSPLGRYLRVAVPIAPTVVRKNMGPEAGASLGTFSFERRDKRFIFHFETKVKHYIDNETTKAPDPPFHLIHETPWESFKLGDEAFINYLNKELKDKIPKIKDFIRYNHKRIIT